METKGYYFTTTKNSYLLPFLGESEKAKIKNPRNAAKMEVGIDQLSQCIILQQIITAWLKLSSNLPFTASKNHIAVRRQ